MGTGGTIITTTSSGFVGIGTTNPTSKLHVVGDGYFTGVVTSSNFYVGNTLVGAGGFFNDIYVSGVTTSLGGFIGNLTGTATTATKLETSRTFEITDSISVMENDSVLFQKERKVVFDKVIPSSQKKGIVFDSSYFGRTFAMSFSNYYYFNFFI